MRISQASYTGNFTVSNNSNPAAATASVDQSTEVLSITEVGVGQATITIANSYGTTATCAVTTN